MFSFTKDYMNCIAQASMFTYQRNERVMDAFDALFGVRQFTKKHPFHDVFWKFVGVEEASRIQYALDDMYSSLKKIPKHSRLQFKLDAHFQERFLSLKKK